MIHLDEVFNVENPKKNGDVESLMRKLSHNMEKKVSLWWDIITFKRYIRENIVPRRLMWEVHLEGLIDQESIDEWLNFFNGKGIKLLRLLLKRKQKRSEQ